MARERIKQTEIEEIPESWESVILGDVCKTTSGGTPSKNKTEYYVNGVIPWLTSSEVNQGLIYDAKQKITRLGLKNSSAKIFPKNTVLIALYGATAGKVGLLNFESATNQAICGILPNDSFISKFLYMYLSTKTKEILTFSSGGAQQNISQAIVRSIKIPLPPLSEQKKIAAVLSKIQQNIDVKEELIKTTTELKKSMMQHLFTYGTKREKTKQTEIGEIPESWEMIKLGDIADITMGQSPSGNLYNESGIGLPFYQGVVDFNDRYVSPRVYCDSPKKIIEAGDILLSVRAPVGKVNFTKEKCSIGRGNAGLRMKNGIQNFLFYLLIFSENSFVMNQSGSTFGSINKSDVENLEVSLPSLPEQKKIASVLSKIDERIQNYEAQKLTLQALFKSMLNKLMTGQIRVHELDIDVSEVE